MARRYVWIFPLEWLVMWWGIQAILVVSSLQILTHCWRSGHLELGWLAALILVWQATKIWRWLHRRVQGE